MLPVPFVGQQSPTTNRYQEDCSLACLVMMLGWAKLNPPTVNALASESSLRVSDTGLGAEEVAALATAHGLPMHVRRGVDVTTLRWEIDRKRPVIIAVNEWKISHRPGDPVGDGSHDLVVVGYVKDTFYCHDPNGVPNMLVPAAELSRAMADRGDTAILVTAADAPPTTRPLARAGTTTDRLRVRAAPSTAAKIMAVLPKGARVLVVEDTPGWLRISGSTWSGYYVAAAFVTF